MRRLGRRGLSLGWQAWLDAYLERQRHKRMLAAAAGRLMRPILTAALTHWRVDWHEARQAMLEQGQRLLRAEAEGHSLKQQQEIDELRAEMAAMASAHEEEKRALAERWGGEVLSKEQEHARALAEQLEAEKEKRVAHIQEMAVRRLGKMDLARG